jgi:DNA repair protein RecN (Recombination protein N)
MLSHLVIRNFAIIEHLSIPFHQGFTVLTGETGAGKSIIIDALNLLLGGRAAADVVRTDESEAVVEAIFEPGPKTLAALHARLDAFGIPTGEDGQLVIRRIVSRSGRNKVFINGSLTTVGTLAQVTAGLIDISGQHEHYSLLDPEGHIDILDAFAGQEGLRAQMSEAFGEVARVRREMRAIREGVRERASRIDFLRFQLEELAQVNLKVGEEEELQQELDRLRHAEKIQDAGRRALALVYEADQSAAQQLSEASGLLMRIAAYDQGLAKLSERLEEIHILAEEAARDLRQRLMEVDSDPRRLDKIIERMEQIKRLKRKHGADTAQIIAAGERMRAELDRLENAEERGLKLDAELEAAQAVAFKLALQLSRGRREAARRLEAALEGELADLNMARTRFVVDFQPAELPSEQALRRAEAGAMDEDEDAAGALAGRLGPHGFDVVEFLIAPNVGEAPKGLAKIASGGELSRIMLAMKSVLVERDAISTYIFDEVDTGIGGSTADMVGEKIAKTSLTHQVLCITHLPQIASRSHHHYLVEKTLVNGRTQSMIRPLDTEERVNEIARMLSGTRVTVRTLEAAREMLGILLN